MHSAAAMGATGLAAAGLLAAGQIGVPAVAAPEPGEDYALQVNTNRVDCSTGRAQFSARGTVKHLPYDTKRNHKFYVDKEIVWDRGTSVGYRELDQRERDSPIFKKKDLQFWTTLADATAIPIEYLGDSHISIHVKSTLRKVRKGPDKRIWVDDRRFWLRGQGCYTMTP